MGRGFGVKGPAMLDMKTGLFLALGAVTIWFVWSWVRLARKTPGGLVSAPRAHAGYHGIVGFAFGFLDTLGIGNFAPTTSAFKLRGTVPDEKIPGTLNIGYALPTVVQAFIYISIVKVDPWTLVLMIGAAVLGAWLGAGVVSRWPRRAIQIGMGIALLAAAGLMLRTQLIRRPWEPLGAANLVVQGFTAQALAPAGAPLGPVAQLAMALQVGGSDVFALGSEELNGPLLWLGLAGNFALGALMTLGIGLYGPCLILVSLLGMNPKAAFPIMMGSCAFLMPIGGIRFVRTGRYSLPTALALTVAAIPAVLVAAYLVKEMSLDVVRWLVVVVVVVTAAMMLRSAFTGPKVPATAVTPDGLASG
jgi:uncharacterized membrane protein YfcA